MIEVHERTSCRSLAVRAVTRGVVRPVLGFFPVRGPMAPFKAAVDLGAALLPRLPSTTFEHISGDGWTAELVTTRDVDPAEGAIVYFHGGAFLFCGLATHRRIVERLAVRTGLPVLSVAYRQLPTHRVETSVSDCVEALNWMIEQGFDPAQIVLAGDSAGGHLAFSVAIEAVAQGVDLGGIVGLSPWLDFDNTARRRHRNAWRDDFIPTFRLDRVARMVTGLSALDPGALAGQPLAGRPAPGAADLRLRRGAAPRRRADGRAPRRRGRPGRAAPLEGAGARLPRPRGPAPREQCGARPGGRLRRGSTRRTPPPCGLLSPPRSRAAGAGALAHTRDDGDRRSRNHYRGPHVFPRIQSR